MSMRENDEVSRMSALAVIPARGGSKRIPRKNIRKFCGKPIMVYTIEAAISSGLFDRVMVSTDDTKIAELSQVAGAEVPFMRSAAMADDYATTDDVVLEVLGEYQKRGQCFDYVCCIYPTAPFVTGEVLREAMRLMEQYRPVQVMPVVQFSYPPQRCFILDQNGYAVFKYPQYIVSRSQDLEKQYHDAGQFYLSKVEEYVNRRGIIYDGIMPMIVSELQVQDIDTEFDWKLAEIKYELMKGGQRKEMEDESQWEQAENA